MTRHQYYKLRRLKKVSHPVFNSQKILSLENILTLKKFSVLQDKFCKDFARLNGKKTLARNLNQSRIPG